MATPTHAWYFKPALVATVHTITVIFYYMTFFMQIKNVKYHVLASVIYILP